MKFIGYLHVLCALLLLIPAGAAQEEMDNNEKPWALRDHYSFAGEKATLHYDVNTAVWKLNIDGLGDVVREVGAEVVLSETTSFPLSSLDLETDVREKFAGPFGAGTFYGSVFKPHSGLQIRSAVARLSQRPFLLLYIQAKNVSDAPIEITALRPAVLDEGGLGMLDDDLKVSRVPVMLRGQFPVVHEDRYSTMYQFELPQRGVTIGLGILQTGRMQSQINLVPAGETWHGSVECRFDPPIHLEPGETLFADPVWISFGTPDPNKVQQFFGWAQSVLQEKTPSAQPPRSWVTVKEGESSGDLMKAARAWKEAGVRHVLAPATWESPPGSLDGATPFFPKNMSTFVAEARTEGLAAGVTIDPLLVGRDGSGDWSVETDNGYRWLDPSSAKGRAYGVERMRKAAAMGVQFFVVQSSRIPDAVLSHFNLTRDEADSLALDIAIEGANGLPVLPAPYLTLGRLADGWRDASRSTAWLKEYGMVSGPVRIDCASLGDLSADLAAAISSYNGPIELMGVPSGKVRSALGRSVSEFPVAVIASAGQ